MCRTSGQIMSYGGIELSSPTLASAMLNLIPAFTFVLALIFRFGESFLYTLIKTNKKLKFTHTLSPTPANLDDFL